MSMQETRLHDLSPLFINILFNLLLLIQYELWPLFINNLTLKLALD